MPFWRTRQTQIRPNKWQRQLEQPVRRFMSKLNTIFSKTLVYHIYHEFWVRYYFKYVLPRINEATLDGIHLDMSNLPVKIRNRILNVGYEDHEKAMCKEFLSPKDSV